MSNNIIELLRSQLEDSETIRKAIVKVLHHKAQNVKKGINLSAKKYGD